MIQQIDDLLEQYRTWLKEKTSLREIDGWIEITTPYLDRHNDCIQIFVRRQDDVLQLTDDGYTIRDLELSGCTLNTPKRQAILETTLNGYGVKLSSRNELIVTASASTFALKKHNLIQAMLAVGDLFYLASSSIWNIFFEDVSRWLDAREIRYAPNVRITGKSGFDSRIEFVVPKSPAMPERFRLINNPTREQAEAVSFSWIDVRDTRPSGARAYAFVNDVNREIPSAVIKALHAYEIKAVRWSKREFVREELAA